MSVLVEKLRELSILGLSGKVNVVQKGNSQHIGIVFLQKGLLVNCLYEDKRGLRPLFDLVLTDYSFKKNFYYIVEPEVLLERELLFHMTLDDFLKCLKNRYLRPWKQFRPPASLKLSVAKEFFSTKSQVSPLENSLLKTITIYSRVSDIYKYSNMLDCMVTSLLVSLRKKGALKVLE